MALKGDRFEDWVLVEYFMNEVAEAGVIVTFDTSTEGVGSSLDDINAAVELPNVAAGSGELVAGLLVGDVVNKDLTQTHLNQHKRESQVGGKVGVARSGSFVTNKIVGTPTIGAPAYFGVDGDLTIVATDSTRVGTWMSAKDSDGYAKIQLNIA